MNKLEGNWQSWDGNSKTKEEFFFLPHQDFNHGLLKLNASVLLMNYADPKEQELKNHWLEAID